MDHDDTSATPIRKQVESVVDFLGFAVEFRLCLPAVFWSKIVVAFLHDRRLTHSLFHHRFFASRYRDVVAQVYL